MTTTDIILNIFSTGLAAALSAAFLSVNLSDPLSTPYNPALRRWDRNTMWAIMGVVCAIGHWSAIQYGLNLSLLAIRGIKLAAGIE